MVTLPSVEAAMSEAALIIEAASRLPLKDAAYELWAKRRELDDLERASPSPTIRDFRKRLIGTPGMGSPWRPSETNAAVNAQRPR